MFVPSLVVITVGTLGIQTLPIRLATYREKGVLRRLSTTPAHPLRLLAAQLVIYLVTAVIALVLLVVVANVAFGVPLPASAARLRRRVPARHERRCSRSGSCRGASRRRTAVATAVAIPMFFVVMFLGGVYLPRVFLPDILVRIGDFTPPGVQGLQDAWLGTAPQAGAARSGWRVADGRGRGAGGPAVPMGVTRPVERAVPGGPAWSSVPA